MKSRANGNGFDHLEKKPSVSEEDTTDKTALEPVALAALERNLERWPVFGLANRTPEAIRVHPGGGDSTSAWIVERAPGPFAADLYVALCKLFNDAHRPSEREITVTFAELATLMRVPRGGKTWQLIRENLIDLKDAPITAIRTFREGATVARERRFNLLGSVTFDHRRDSDKGATIVTVEFSREVAESIASGYYRLLDANLYFSLNTPTARRLYRYLDARRWYGSEQQERILLLLSELRDRLPIGSNAPSDVKRTLDGAHCELINRGFLRSADYQKQPRAGRGLDAWSVDYAFTDPQLTPVEGQSTKHLAPAGKPPGQAELGFGPLTDPHYLRETVGEILTLLQDEHSKDWYTKVVKALPEPVMRRVIGAAREAVRDDRVGLLMARRRFSLVAKQAAAEAGVEL